MDGFHLLEFPGLLVQEHRAKAALQPAHCSLERRLVLNLANQGLPLLHHLQGLLGHLHDRGVREGLLRLGATCFMCTIYIYIVETCGLPYKEASQRPSFFKANNSKGCA